MAEMGDQTCVEGEKRREERGDDTGRNLERMKTMMMRSGVEQNIEQN